MAFLGEFDPKDFNFSVSTSSRTSGTVPVAGKMPGNISIPNLGSEPSLDPLVKDLAGSLRTRSDAAADASIANFSRRTGGDTGSPLFQFLSTTARGQAAGQTGATLANLRLQAEEGRAGRQLAREQAQQSAMLNLQQLNNAWALGQGSLALQTELGRGDLDLRRRQVGLQEDQADFSNLLGLLSNSRHSLRYNDIQGELMSRLGVQNSQGKSADLMTTR